MNKKFKIIIALTMIVQLLIPAVLLYHHYTIREFALNHSIDYKIRINGLYLSDYRAGSDPTDTRYCLDYYINNYRLYNKKVAVTIGEDGFAQLSELDKKSDSDCWFEEKYYREKRYLRGDDFKLEEGVDRWEINRKSAQLESDELNENECFYLTAKVYKGLFIPTAIYFCDEKIATIFVD